MPIDLERIQDATGGDAEFLAELVEIFLEDAQLRLEELKSAIERQDEDELKRTAHKLKGSSANMGAAGLMSIAKSIEDQGRFGSVAEGQAVLLGADQELTRVKEALERLVAEGA